VHHSSVNFVLRIGLGSVYFDWLVVGSLAGVFRHLLNKLINLPADRVQGSPNGYTHGWPCDAHTAAVCNTRKPCPADHVYSHTENHPHGNRPCARFTERLNTRPALCTASVNYDTIRYDTMHYSTISNRTAYKESLFTCNF